MSNDKKLVVKRLREGRLRKSLVNRENGILTLNGQPKVTGRKSYREMNPELVKTVKRLRRKNPATGQIRSLRKISDMVYEMGFTNTKGDKIGHGEIKSILNQ